MNSWLRSFLTSLANNYQSLNAALIAQGDRMNIQILALAMVIFSSVANSAVLIDVTKIAGKSLGEVNKIIGVATKCIDSKYGKKCTYALAETEIVYINGKADWITVEGIDDIPFDSAAIESIGLPTIKPTFKNSFTIRYSGIAGLREVSLFKGSNNSDYAYIKAFTK